MTEKTCSHAPSDKGSCYQERPSDPSDQEKHIGASRQNILRTEERGSLNVWTDFNRTGDSESPDDYDENYSYKNNNTVLVIGEATSILILYCLWA